MGRIPDGTDPTLSAGPSSNGVRFHLPDGSRSVQSPWVWRGFLFMSFIAFGLCLTFATGGKVFLAVAWGLITTGWFAIAMWLWRKHILDDNAARDASRRTSGAA